MKKLIASLLLLGFALNAYATPTLQVHGVGSVTGSHSGDEDTWFMSGETGSVELIATFTDTSMKIENSYIVLTTSAVADNPFAGFTKYDDSDAFEASIGASFNNHDPYGAHAAQIDTFVLSYGDFVNTYTDGDKLSKDCNASYPDVPLGTTECTLNTNGKADIKLFNYDFTGLGLDWVHFDLVAYVSEERGRVGSGRWAASWDINPGSHDTTWERTSVPEASSLLLLMVGLLGLVALKRKA